MADEKPDTLESSAQTLTPGVGLTPVYSNRFHLWANEQIMRFVIGDSVTGQDVDFKFSFVMTRNDAAELAKVIVDLLAQTAPKQTGDQT